MIKVSDYDLAQVAIEVESPQFGESYEYYYDWDRKQLFDGRYVNSYYTVTVDQYSGKSNEFIGKCLLLVLAFALHFDQNCMKLKNLTRIHKVRFCILPLDNYAS